MRPSLAGGVVVVAACGRIGFAPVGDGGSDAVTTSCASVASTDWLGVAVPNDPGAGLPHPEAYTTTVDTVADHVTGLLWQRAPAPSAMTWSQASAYCASLSLAGCTSWRLPQRVELGTLVDHTFGNPAIDQNAFPGTQTAGYWSATPHTSSGNTWIVNFDNGNSFWVPTGGTQATRCVTGGTVPDQPPARYQAATGMVLDVDTGLTWQSPTNSTFDQPGAAAACAQDGFRLPSVRELWTLLDTANASALFDATTFSGTPLGTPYWTASPFGIDFMSVSFDDGSTVNAPPSMLLYAWCVR